MMIASVLIVLTMVECRDSLSVGTIWVYCDCFLILSWIIAQLVIDEQFSLFIQITINIYLKRYV